MWMYSSLIPNFQLWLWLERWTTSCLTVNIFDLKRHEAGAVIACEVEASVLQDPRWSKSDMPPDIPIKHRRQTQHSNC